MKSIRKNYIYNAAYQVLLLVVPLILAPYISRVLGPDGVGEVSFSESIVTYFTLFATMGITIYGQREISYVRDDILRRSEVFWNTKLLEFCSGGIAFALYIPFALTRGNVPVYLALSLNLVSVIADVTWFFQGMEEFGKTVARNAITKCLLVAYVFIFVRDKDDLVLYALGLGLFTAIGNVSLWFYLPRYVTKVPLARLHPLWDLKVVWSLFVPTIAMHIYTVLDKTMIGLITRDDFQNGYYEQAIKMSKMVLAVVTALGAVMVPRIGYHFNHGDHEEIRRLMYRGYRFVWFLGIPLCFGMVAVAGNFVPWFFGEGYDGVVPLLHVLPFLILAIGINNVTGIQYLIPTKRENMYTLTVIIGAGVNFTLNMILITLYDAIGAAIASVAAETAIAVVQLVLVRRELSPLRVLREGTHYLAAGIAMLAILLLLNRMLTPSVPNTVLLVLCGTAVYILALLIFRDEFFLSNVKRMKNILPIFR